MSRYHKPKFLETLKVQALRARMVGQLRKHPPEIGLFAARDWWLWQLEYLTADENETFGLIEVAVGEKEAVAWLQAVFKESGWEEHFLKDSA
jgi:hypothetical protein